MSFCSDFDIVINVVENALAMMQMNTPAIISNWRLTLGHARKVIFVKCVIPLTLYRILGTIAPMVTTLGSPFTAMITRAKIMNQNGSASYEISMKSFNFEVINLNRLNKTLSCGGIDISFFAIQQLQLITNYQILGCNPALSLYKEGMSYSGGNGFAIYQQVYQFELLIAEKTNDTLQRTFASLWIFSPYQLVRFDFFNRNQTIFGMDQRASDKAMSTADTTSNETTDGTTEKTVYCTVNSCFQRVIPAAGFDTALNSTGNSTANSTRNSPLGSANGGTGSNTGHTAGSNCGNDCSANNDGGANCNLGPVGQGPGASLILEVDRIIHAVDEELIAVNVTISTHGLDIIRIDEAAQIRIVVSAAQIVQPGFFIIDVAAILKGVQFAKRVGQRTSRVNDLSPSIVRIGYYLDTSIVNQANDIILLVIKVSIGSTVKLDNRGLVFCCRDRKSGAFFKAPP